MAGSSWDGCHAIFDVPKGTKIKEITDLLEVDHLDRYDWLDGRISAQIIEGEIQSLVYWIDLNKRHNFRKIYEHFRENDEQIK